MVILKVNVLLCIYFVLLYIVLPVHAHYSSLEHTEDNGFLYYCASIGFATLNLRTLALLIETLIYRYSEGSSSGTLYFLFSSTPIILRPLRERALIFLNVGVGYT